jgi:hypothetical protein
LGYQQRDFAALGYQYLKQCREILPYHDLRDSQAMADAAMGWGYYEPTHLFVTPCQEIKNSLVIDHDHEPGRGETIPGRDYKMYDGFASILETAPVVEAMLIRTK